MKPSATTPVRIGVVGLGNFGMLHAMTLAGLAESELVALVARRQASLDAVNNALHAKAQSSSIPGYLDLDHAIADTDAEAWVVASSTASHVAITKKLLEAGKTVLLEKPVSDNLQTAQDLKDLVKPDSSNLMLGHIVLFNSEYLHIINEATQRGPIVYIDCVRHRPMTTMQSLPGESPFHLTMVHDLYSVLALGKRAEPCGFTAQVHHAASGQVDLAMAQLQWSNGMIASFAASFLTPAGMADDGFDRMEVFGTDWMARMEPNPRPMTLWDDRAHWPMALEIRNDPIAPSGMLAEELRCFCRVVRGLQGVPIGATYQDAIQVNRWLDNLEKINHG